MVGIFSSFMLAGLLTANPTGFTFEGPKVSAQTTGSTGFFTQGAVPFTDLFERGTGSATLSVQERIAIPQATYGDVGRLEATFTLGGTVYRVELDQAGFPPPGAPGGRTGLPLPPAQAIAGGVVVNQDLHGGAMLGFPNMTRVRAAAAVWGVGRLWRNGQLISDTAIIHAAALEQGAHADDDTFRVLPVARPGDTELDVLVWNLPLSAEPRGFIQFDFDDVTITRDGINLPAVAVVPNAGVFYGLAPASSPVPGGVALGAVPNTAVSSSGQGVGGSGLAGTGGVSTDGLSDPVRTQQLAPQADVTLPGVARQLGGGLEPFLDAGRVSLSTQNPSQPDVVTPGSPPTVPIVPDAFSNAELPGRVAIGQQSGSAGQAQRQLPGASTTPFVPEAFQDAARVRTNSELPPATVGGFVPLTSSSQAYFPSSNGSYSVVPLVPGVSGAAFAFGGSRVASGLVTSPTPGNVQTSAVPLVASPQTLNGQTAVPLVASPLPLNGQSAVPFIATPTPLGSQSVSASLPGAGTPATTLGAPSVPGLVTGTTPATAPGAAPNR